MAARSSVGHANLGERADDLVALDLGEMELRQADLLDGELRHLMSSSVRASVDRKDTPDTRVGDRRPRYSSPRDSQPPSTPGPAGVGRVRTMADASMPDSPMSRRRTIAIGAGLAAAGAAVRRHRGTRRVPTDPFDPDAVRAETAAVRDRRARRTPAGPAS